MQELRQIVVHILDLTLGKARWGAVSGTQCVKDAMPVKPHRKISWNDVITGFCMLPSPVRLLPLWGSGRRRRHQWLRCCRWICEPRLAPRGERRGNPRPDPNSSIVPYQSLYLYSLTDCCSLKVCGFTSLYTEEIKYSSKIFKSSLELRKDEHRYAIPRSSNLFSQWPYISNRSWLKSKVSSLCSHSVFTNADAAVKNTHIPLLIWFFTRHVILDYPYHQGCRYTESW